MKINMLSDLLETGDHSKNGASSKSLQVGLNVKKLLIATALLFFWVGKTISVLAQNSNEADYYKVRENEHFIFEISFSQLKGNISLAHLQRWLSYLDAAYAAYAELLGNHLPCNNGNIIKIVEVINVGYWAAAPIGGCEIMWSSDNGITKIC